MCTNYHATPRDRLPSIVSAMRTPELEWPRSIYRDFDAPIIIRGESEPELIIASYSMVPKRHLPPHDKNRSTMNARAETIGQKQSFAKSWKAAQLCLVPLIDFIEWSYEKGDDIAERYAIGMADDSPFAVAGLWRSWDEHDGTTAHSFTQITVNAEHHPLMKRFHKKNDEKRSLVIIPESEYDDWLQCTDPDKARVYLQLYPAELMKARPAPKQPKEKRVESTDGLF